MIQEALLYRKSDLFSLSGRKNAAMKSMEPLPGSLAYRVRKLRELRGFDRQEDLAAAAGIKQSSLSDIERGTTKEPTVRASTIVGLSRALNVTWEYLLEGEAGDALALETAELVAIYRAVGPASRFAILQAARAVQQATPTSDTVSLDLSPEQQLTVEKIRSGRQRQSVKRRRSI